MRVKYEVSAGGLLLRPRESSYEALLIGRRSPRIWALPKGHVERHESMEQAALREVREETGCWGEIVARLNEIGFWFFVDQTKHHKTVTFFLMRYLSGDPAHHNEEVDEARWFELNAARRALKYVNEKRLIDMALDYIAEHPSAFGEIAESIGAVQQTS
jgi:8-oxo-dGTP diphosphatase